MKHLDLFSGIGGFALAARWAGFETFLFCEIDPFCQKVLNKNFPKVPIFGDIKFLSVQYHQVDILTAGFPCQPFSVAGKQKGKNDDRYLWPETFRIIKLSHPHWLILENVPGIIPHLDVILEDLEREGYTWEAYLIPASALGAPHKRERIWIIAHSDGNGCDSRCDNGKKRHVQGDWQRHIQAIQSEWPQCFPQSWASFNAQDWLESAADTSSERQSREGTLGQPLHTESNSEGKAGYVVDDPNNSEPSGEANTKSLTQPPERDTRRGYSGQSRQNSTFFNWEENKPPIPGMDVRLPQGLDRNRALGNSIVPQIAWVFMKLIYLCSKNEI